MDSTDQDRILVLSNRLPITMQKTAKGWDSKRSSGGLITAIEPILNRGQGLWMGWPGSSMAADDWPQDLKEPFQIFPIMLSDNEIARYYHGFSNRTLWPLFHSFPEQTSFHQKDWEAYEKINHRFAKNAAPLARDVDLIWIHDYHLLRTPSHIRKLAGPCKIAFFLHIPFPPFDIFRLLPWNRNILRGLLGSDLIGFHVRGYAQNFLDCAEKILGARVDRQEMLVEHGDRTVQVGQFPLGIDFELFEKRARKAPINKNEKRMILGVDRLDYTKGILERLRSFERLLELHPEYREQIRFLQLAVPSRSQVQEYRKLKREIDENVGRINGRFGTPNWVPIQYLYRSFSPERLSELYRDAEIALITPLRDGMNLVAKEFIACQVDKPGVLILSRLAGAAETMPEALLVNPYDIDGTAKAIHQALCMSEDERQTRLTALRYREKTNNVYEWNKNFLGAAFSTRAKLAPPTPSDFKYWLNDYLKEDIRLALFLDYDGTLSSIAGHPNEATLSPSMRKTFEQCLNNPRIDITIVSGRPFFFNPGTAVGHFF